MKTPYQILGISEDASDDQIKRAYLQKVKENPPDREQLQFQKIHHAYLSIKDEKSRISFALFNIEKADFDHLINHMLTVEMSTKPDSEQMMQLLSVSIDDETYSNALTSFKQ